MAWLWLLCLSAVSLESLTLTGAEKEGKRQSKWEGEEGGVGGFGTRHGCPPETQLGVRSQPVPRSSPWSARPLFFIQPFPFIASHLSLQRIQFPALKQPSLTTALPVHPNLSGAGADRGDKTPEYRPLLYSGSVALRSRRLAAVSHVRAFKEPGFKNVGHLK